MQWDNSEPVTDDYAQHFISLRRSYPSVEHQLLFKFFAGLNLGPKCLKSGLSCLYDVQC